MWQTYFNELGWKHCGKKENFSFFNNAFKSHMLLMCLQVVNETLQEFNKREFGCVVNSRKFVIYNFSRICLTQPLPDTDFAADDFSKYQSLDLYQILKV